MGNQCSTCSRADRQAEQLIEIAQSVAETNALNAQPSMKESNIQSEPLQSESQSDEFEPKYFTAQERKETLRQNFGLALI